jgi:hypothetical protein
MIQSDDQMRLRRSASRISGESFWRRARSIQRKDYVRMAQPILLEVQQREQEILEYLSRDIEQPLAS